MSAHFTFSEAVFSSTAERLGIDNTPGETVVANMRAAAPQLEAVRALLGFALRVDSWFRCEALERVLCANDFRSWCVRHDVRDQDRDRLWPQYFKRKAHPLGWAIDFTCAAFGAPVAIVQKITQSGIKFDQCISEGAWVHLSFNTAMRNQVLTAHFNGGAVSYTQGT